MKKKVVGLGEVLWDVLPERTCLGGAPANFAYITTLMGDQGIVASRVGEDSLGIDALRHMDGLASTSTMCRRTRSVPRARSRWNSTRKGRRGLRSPIRWPG